MLSLELQTEGVRSTLLGSQSPGSDRVALVASVDEWSVRALQSVLEPKGYRVLHAANSAETLALAESSRPDVVWIWFAHGGGDAADLCGRLRQEALIPSSTPILIVGLAPVVRAQRLAGFRAGAWDVLTFPFDAEEMLLKLDAFAGAKRDADHARQESLLDPVSGLYGQHGMERRARELLADASRRRIPLACVVLGADPSANERPAASATPVFRSSVATQHVAPLLHAHGRLSDTIGRWSDTEFAVLAPATDAGGAEKLAARLARVIEAAAPSGSQAFAGLEVRAGYEVVESFGSDLPSSDDLLVHASAALHKARAGRSLPPFQRYRSESSPELRG
jgi:PleD family two-component response regulator